MAIPSADRQRPVRAVGGEDGRLRQERRGVGEEAGGRAAQDLAHLAGREHAERPDRNPLQGPGKGERRTDVPDLLGRERPGRLRQRGQEPLVGPAADAGTAEDDDPPRALPEAGDRRRLAHRREDGHHRDLPPLSPGVEHPGVEVERGGQGLAPARQGGRQAPLRRQQPERAAPGGARGPDLMEDRHQPAPPAGQALDEPGGASAPLIAIARIVEEHGVGVRDRGPQGRRRPRRHRPSTGPGPGGIAHQEPVPAAERAAERRRVGAHPLVGRRQTGDDLEDPHPASV